jgi:hypothetical protein
MAGWLTDLRLWWGGPYRYIVRGIFFKLAFDFKLGNVNPVWMYGGNARSDEFAIKASGHGALLSSSLCLDFLRLVVVVSNTPAHL